MANHKICHQYYSNLNNYTYFKFSNLDIDIICFIVLSILSTLLSKNITFPLVMILINMTFYLFKHFLLFIFLRVEYFTISPVIL